MPYSWNKKGNQAKPPGGRRGGKMGKPPASGRSGGKMGKPPVSGRSGGKMGKPPRPSDYDMENTLRQSVTDQIEELRSIAAGLASAMQGSSQTDADMAQRQALAQELAVSQMGSRPSDADVQRFMPPGPPPGPPGMMPSPGMMPEAAQAQRQALAAEMAARLGGARPSDRDVRQGFMPPEPPPLPQGPAINPGEIPPPMPTPESARAERMRRITAMARKRIGMK